jgi:hypothetical protein
MTSPLLPHARALLAAATPGRNAKRGCPDLDPNWPGPDGRPRGPVSCVTYPNCTCGNVDRAHGRKALIAAAPTLLSDLCTALEASEAEAGRLRAQLAHLTAEAGAESCAAFASEANALRVQLAEAGRIALEMSGQTLDWDQEDFYRACLAGQFTTLATIRTEVLK